MNGYDMYQKSLNQESRLMNQNQIRPDHTGQIRTLKRDRLWCVVALLFVTCALIYTAWAWEQERERAQQWMDMALSVNVIK